MERVILHADLNNFYASVECQRHPELAGSPVAVAGSVEERHGIILAKNILAKSCGVQTGEPIWKARKKCPGLICLPPDFERYMRFSSQVRDIYARYTDKIEPFGLDEAWLDVSQCGRGGEEMADLFRDIVREEMGATISVGGSFNKVFAKLGSDMKKPDATTVISRENFREKVWPLPAEELLYVGRVTKRKLNRVGIFTIGEIARADRTLLRMLLGKWGDTLGTYARGEENAPVLRMGESAAVKSIGNSMTPPRDLLCPRDAELMFYVLAESVAARLRAHGLRCGGVAISVRDCELQTYTRQKRLRKPTNLSGEIAGLAMELFCASYHWERPVRSVGVAGFHLTGEDREVQLCCLDDGSAERARNAQMESAVDEIRRRFGQKAVMRGALLGTPFGALNPKEENIIYPAGFQETPDVW